MKHPEKILSGRRASSQKIMVGIGCVALYVLLVNLPTPAGLTLPGQKALALMVVASICWMFEVVPLGIASAFFVLIVGGVGITTQKQAMATFAIPTIFFILSSYVIAIAFVETGLAYRASLFMSGAFGAKSSRVLLAFMVGPALLATMLADVPTSLIFAATALPLLKKNGCAPGNSNFGKAIMMGIPIAAASGGISTPAGSGLNVLTMALLRNTAGVEITFAKWAMIGLPTGAILTAAAYYAVLKMVPPEFEYVKGIGAGREELGPWNIKEKKLAAIFLASRLLWFTDAWHKIDITVVAVAAATACFLPGINLVDWKQAKDRIGWDVLLLVGASNVLAMAITEQQGALWLTDTFLSGLAGANIILLLFAVVAFGIYSHLVLPVANAMLAVAIPVTAVIAARAGISPAVLAIPTGFCASCVFLLPLDPIPLTTYEHGYWKLAEMMKPGFVISLFWLVALTAVMYAVWTLGML